MKSERERGRHVRREIKMRREIKKENEEKRRMQICNSSNFLGAICFFWINMSCKIFVIF